jgi:hypothetical protein
VLASLIFVALQLRQNTEAVRASSSQAQEAEIQNLLQPIVEEEGVAELWRIGLDQGSHTLSDNQRVRWLVIMGGVTRYYHASWLMRKQGWLDKGLWHHVEHQARDVCAEKGFQDYWNARRHWFSPEFGAWIESLPKPTHGRGLYGPNS